MHRRAFLAAAAAFAFTSAQAGEVDIEEILNDPAAPVAGDPQGDVTVVAFLDYNCPFCKKSAPGLARLLQADPHVRLVYKDWPVIAPTSVDGAKFALAAKYQDKYDAAHAAMMALQGRSSVERFREALKTAGLDMNRLDADLAAHADDIAALLKRNGAEADSLGLQGTPVFLIGPYKVAAAVDYDEFARVVDNARARQNGQEPAQ
jgi:protein-disulfide isomerase